LAQAGIHYFNIKGAAQGCDIPEKSVAIPRKTKALAEHLASHYVLCYDFLCSS
jgi:hypothetical protein